MKKDRVLALLEQRKKISDFLHENSDDLKRVHNISQLDSSPGSAWVLQLADNITLATRAPAGWAPSRPLHDFHGHPPAPQFEQMRAGKLEALHIQHLKDQKATGGAAAAGAAASSSTSSSTTTTTTSNAGGDDDDNNVSTNSNQQQRKRKRKLRVLRSESVEMYVGINATRLPVASESDEEDEENDVLLDAAEKRRQEVEARNSSSQANALSTLLSSAPPAPSAAATTGSTRQIHMSFGGDDSSDDDDGEVESD